MGTTDPALAWSPPRRLWTREEYERAAQLGLFGPEERLELIDGEIVQKMTQNPPHRAATQLTEASLRKVFVAGYVIQVQMPIALASDGEPEPDVSVVRGTVQDYLQSHPTTAVLVVEVADSSLDYDRGKKARLYATTGILDYWIVNLTDRVLEVYRDPVPDEQPGSRYSSRQVLGPKDTVSPLVAPGCVVPVADLLP